MISSYPHITSYTFRYFSDVAYLMKNDSIHAKRKKDKPINKLNDGDVIYVVTEKIPFFFKKVEPKIKCKYHLISGRSDLIVDQEYEKFITSKTLSWHSINCTSDVIKPIPLGLCNKNWDFDNFPQGEIKYFDEVNGEDIEKDCDILMAFSIITNATERSQCFDYFKDKEFITNRGHDRTNTANRKNPTFFMDYLRAIRQHKFVLCPWGNGIDCHRNYDVWLMGGIPIIKRHKALEMCYDLPAWWIDDWSEVTKENIDQKYKEITTKEWNLEKLSFDYWFEKIKKSNG